MFLTGPVQAERAEIDDLPADVVAQTDALWRPLAERALAGRRRPSGPVVLGLCGPQGSGKSTGARMIQALLRDAGARTAILSLDDLYLGRSARARLAAQVHPLFATRGPPGTHDVALGEALLDALGRPGIVRPPRFDKAIDDRADAAAPALEAPLDVLVFEGWCVGARPQQPEALAAPVNVLEAMEDPAGIWRRAVNAALADDYQRLFARIDVLALLRAPSFGVVRAWRGEQEQALRARTGAGMSDAALDRFVQHYERLSRWIDVEAPARADVVIQLDAARRPLSVDLR